MPTPEQLLTGFERDPERADELGAAVEDVAQEAIDATAAAYTNDAGIDVEERLGVELWTRGLRASEDVRTEIAAEIRSGHQVRLGRSDGSTA